MTIWLLLRGATALLRRHRQGTTDHDDRLTETLVFFRINEVELCGRVSPTAGAREGARLRLCASLDNMHLIDEASGQVI